MILCGTRNGSSMASLEEPFEAPLFLRVCTTHNATVPGLIMWYIFGEKQLV